MTTENREITITLRELRTAAGDIVDTLNAGLAQKPSNDVLPLVHAYVLGAVMKAAGITPESVPVVFKFVRLGYEDYGSVDDERTQ